MSKLRLNVDQFLELCAKDSVTTSKVELGHDLDQAEADANTEENYESDSDY